MRALLLCLLVTTAHAELSPAVRKFVTIDAPIIALTHVRIIDGTGRPPIEDQTLIISDGRITLIRGAVCLR